MHFGRMLVLIFSQVNEGLIWDGFRHADTYVVALQEALEIIKHLRYSKIK